MANFWGLTFAAMVKFFFGFSQRSVDDGKLTEGNYRLQTIFYKNKYGYATNIMSDFELFLEAALNDTFIDNSIKYYADAHRSKEIEDMEAGLVHDFAPADIRELNRDADDDGHHAPFLSIANPDRVGTNYDKSDALSCYKILPKGQKPLV